jgi:hypothetical protein
MNQHTESRGQGYPLSTLFLLIAVCAISSALVAPAVRSAAAGKTGLWDHLSASLGGMLLMTCLGAVIGLYHYRRTRGLLWGMITGATLGAFFGPIALTPGSDLHSLVSLSIGGSLLVIAVGVAMRFASQRRGEA